MEEPPETGSKATEHAPVAEDEIYTRANPDSLVAEFFKVHRIGSTYFVYLQNDGALTEEEKWLYTGHCFETGPESAHEAMLRQGFKWFNQEWWKA